ncbi:MAG: hypothetical protein ACRDIB_14615 [Ardenticatenaceae bacterium]
MTKQSKIQNRVPRPEGTPGESKISQASFVLVILVLWSLAGCQRGAGTGTPEPLPPLATPPTPVLEEPPLVEYPGAGSGGDATPAVGVLPTSPLFAGQFTNLRFASSATGESQSNFPVGTEEIYAIWDYDGMSASDAMERLWFHNGELYVERSENWDFAKYGTTGAVRDIFLYDRIDGIDPGQWRVELYLNGELQQTAEYTVGGP